MIVFAVIGGLVATVAGIWLLVEAFKVSVLWGLGSIFIPFVSLIFVILHWGQAKKPFLISVGATVVMMIGMVPAMNEFKEQAAAAQAEAASQLEQRSDDAMAEDSAP